MTKMGGSGSNVENRWNLHYLTMMFCWVKGQWVNNGRKGSKERHQAHVRAKNTEVSCPNLICAAGRRNGGRRGSVHDDSGGGSRTVLGKCRGWSNQMLFIECFNFYNKNVLKRCNIYFSCIQMTIPWSTKLNIDILSIHICFIYLGVYIVPYFQTWLASFPVKIFYGFLECFGHGCIGMTCCLADGCVIVVV